MASKSYTWTVGQHYEEIVEASGTSPQDTAETAAIAADDEADTAVTLEADVDETALAAAIAAAQLIGTGDASAEIDALDAAYVAYQAKVALLQAQIATLKTATAAAETAASDAAADDDIVRIASGVKPLDAIVGLDMIKQKIATSKLY